MEKLIAVKLDYSNLDEFIEIQHYLFSNGFQWKEDKKEIKKYIPNEYLLFDNKYMYSLSIDFLKELKTHNNLKVIDNVKSYFRYQKIKKITK